MFMREFQDSAVLGYDLLVVSEEELAHPNQRVVKRHVCTSQTTCKVEGLRPSTRYACQVRAFNDCGWSTWSQPCHSRTLEAFSADRTPPTEPIARRELDEAPSTGRATAPTPLQGILACPSPSREGCRLPLDPSSISSPRPAVRPPQSPHCARQRLLLLTEEGLGTVSPPLTYRSRLTARLQELQERLPDPEWVEDADTAPPRNDLMPPRPPLHLSLIHI